MRLGQPKEKVNKVSVPLTVRPYTIFVCFVRTCCLQAQHVTFVMFWGCYPYLWHTWRWWFGVSSDLCSTDLAQHVDRLVEGHWYLPVFCVLPACWAESETIRRVGCMESRARPGWSFLVAYWGFHVWQKMLCGSIILLSVLRRISRRAILNWCMRILISPPHILIKMSSVRTY